MTTSIVGIDFDVLTSAYELLPDPAIGCDADGRIVWGNSEATKLFGATNGDFHGVLLGDFLPGVREWMDKGGFLPMVRCGELDCRTELNTANGKRRAVCCRSRRIATPDRAGYLVLITLRDVTDWSELESRLRSMVMTDDLTGLYNRRYLDSVLLFEEERARRYGLKLGIAFLDVDNFKSINDTWGHPAGDKVLVAVAHAIRASCRKIDTLCRWGGDEFVLLFLVHENHDMELILNRIVVGIAETATDVGDDVVRITASCGAAVGSCPEINQSSFLFESADNLLLEAKRYGKNKVILRQLET